VIVHTPCVVMMSDSSRRQPLEVNIPRGSERKLSYPTEGCGRSPYWRLPPGTLLLALGSAVRARRSGTPAEATHRVTISAPSRLQLTRAGNPPQLTNGGPPNPPQRSDSECLRGTERAVSPRLLPPLPHAGVPHRPRQPPPPSADPGGRTSQPDDPWPLAPTPSTRYDTNVCGMVEPCSLDVCRPAHSQSGLWPCCASPQPETVRR
jgi:hypothetical protein